ARHVTEVGEQRSVVASEDIFSESGHKLVARDSALNRRMYEKLTRHKLQRPLDHSLSVEEAVDTHDLLITGRAITEQSRLMEILGKDMDEPQLPLEILASVRLITPMAAKLTVMRERLPHQFEHSIQVALYGVALAIRSGHHYHEFLREIATAGLFHDLGCLHIEPAIFEQSRSLEPDEERQLRAHPLIASILLEEFREYPEAVHRAVLEHHERLDGTGYPYGLEGEAIGNHGRILAAAEMVSGLSSRRDGRTLGTILRSQPEKLDASVVRGLLQALRQCPESKELVEIEPDALIAEWCETLKLIEQARELHAEQGRVIRQAMEARLESLERTLDRTGLRGNRPEEWADAIRESPEAALELAALSREGRFMLREIATEIRYRLYRARAKGKHAAGEEDDESLSLWMAAVTKR
ncbi:MAG: HD domain-containing phosphohydrolase, partial [Thiohalospira sp.]